MRRRHVPVAAGLCLIALTVSSVSLWAQAPPAAAPPPAPPQLDALGRDTPRGTVLGFLAAARKGDDEVARQYLDTAVTGNQADTLSNQLFVVLDARLPARLDQLSDAPEGARANPLRPDQEVVGTIAGAGGRVEVIVERVARGSGNPIWLFSRTTLEAILPLYEEVSLGWSHGLLPRVLIRTRLGGVRLFEWLAVLLGLPLTYLVTVLLNKLLTPVIRGLAGRFAKQSTLFDGEVLPIPVRLLILAMAVRWFASSVPLSLLVRQFWSNLANLFTIVGIAWLLVLLNSEGERYIQRRFPRSSVGAPAALLRVGRRMVDLLVIFGGAVAIIRHFGVDPTPALAGLGVGGIAVALAAQKTLENVIAGASLIFDQAVRVGDFLKMGEVQGTVEHIGLRSTRIRTLDRTIVSVPNGQIANMSLETFSARDKFWFHPTIGVRPETTATQLHAVVDGIRRLLDGHASVDRLSVRVRFLCLSEYSLDVDVFAYVFARDWNHFLEIQEQLLFSVTEIVESAGTQIAFRSLAMIPGVPQVTPQ